MLLNLSRLCFPSLCRLWANQRLHLIVSLTTKDETQQPNYFKKKTTIVQSIECKLCYKKFSKEAHLISHQETLHTNATEFLHRELFPSDFQFNCTICKTKCVTKSLLRNHIMKHQNQKYELLRRESFDLNTKMFKCKLCYSTFRHFSSLPGHVRSIHGKDESFCKKKASGLLLPAVCFTPAGPRGVSQAGASSTTAVAVNKITKISKFLHN